jgi:hypothetical protein
VFIATSENLIRRTSTTHRHAQRAHSRRVLAVNALDDRRRDYIVGGRPALAGKTALPAPPLRA